MADFNDFQELINELRWMRREFSSMHWLIEEVQRETKQLNSQLKEARRAQEHLNNDMKRWAASIRR